MDTDNNRWDDIRGVYDRSEMETDTGVGPDGPDLDFNYNDTDTHPNEIAELYSYTEQLEFQQNIKAFESQMEYYKITPSWQKQSDSERKGVILKLLDQLDMSKRTLRQQATRCILYLAQGCYAEVQSDAEQQTWSRTNVMMLYEFGVFSAFVELLNLEIENTTTANVAIRKVAVSLAESVDLRVILSVLYIITEVIRAEKYLIDSKYKHIVENFINEINHPFGDELLTVKLLGMITKFCSGTAPHFPMKKVLLLLWKISLVGLGGMETLKQLKEQYRAQYGLSPTKEDTLEVARNMRASSPPPSAADILENPNPNPKRNRPFRRVRTNEIYQEILMKQSSLDEQEQIANEMDAQQQAESEDDMTDYYRPFDDPSMNSQGMGIGDPKYDQPNSLIIPMRTVSRLPWTPKVRQKDIIQFLEASRNKFIGFTLPEDHMSIAGLPEPIHEGFKTLNQHVYISLGDVQIKREEEIARNPILKCEGDIPLTPAEILYQGILPNLPQYMIALLKILLAAAPTSKAKTESINIMADVLPEEMPMTVTQSTKLGIDVNRHKEIIVKAVSAILLLYLKHFKINHVYQFEFMSQHLVFANCIPLVLKFFNQNITNYIGSQNCMPIMDFPACILGETAELTADSLVIGGTSTYSWRNTFSCINLLRILNKLTKWKHSRIMMLVVFKSAPILKRALKVRHAMMQLYVLKLLKMQTKYLGRQWRKTNMKTISAIYAKVRHRLNDDWAFGNDLDARPWDFQAEECTLRTCVDRFINRRYLSCNNSSTTTSNAAGGSISGTSVNRSTTAGNCVTTNNNNNNNNINNNGTGLASGGTAIGIGVNTGGSGSFNAVINDLSDYDHHLLDVNSLNAPQKDKLNYTPGYGGWDEIVELSDEFKQHYEMWLQQEVFNTQINWDSLTTSIKC